MMSEKKTELKLGEHTLPKFSSVDAAFGADRSAYPPFARIPEQYSNMHNRAHRAAAGLFYEGGVLADHGFKLKPDVDKNTFMVALRALLSSFAPAHEVKMGTCAWLIDTYCDEIREAS